MSVYKRGNRWIADVYIGGRNGRRIRRSAPTRKLAIYLSLLSAVPSLKVKLRVAFLLSGFPLIFAFHTIDLIIIVESKLLTVLQPERYVFWGNFSPWFVAVKFYHSFSMLAFKQAFPVLLLGIQWYLLGRQINQSHIVDFFRAPLPHPGSM